MYVSSIKSTFILHKNSSQLYLVIHILLHTLTQAIMHTYVTLEPQASDCEPGTFACAYARQAIIMAWNVTNLTLQGEGTIDGAGQDWWACAHDLSASPCSGHARPHLLDVFLSSNIRMYDLNIQNSPDWTLHFSGVSDLHVRNVNVVNPSNAPNSDGIDLDCVSGALVEDSYVVFERKAREYSYHIPHILRISL